MHQDPAQAELRQGHPGRHERAQLFHRGERKGEVHAREGLPAVEGGPLAVEGPMIVGGEGGAGRHLSGQHPRGERQPGEDAHPAPGCLGQEPVGRALAEDIEDNLHGLYARELDGLERLLHPLDAHAVGADLPFRHQSVEGAEDLGSVVDLGGRAVQLQKVEGLDLQVLEAPLHEGFEVFVVVAVRHVGGEASSSI